MSKAVELNATTFRNEVLESPTPVLVDFWAEWCMPCRMLGPVIDEVAGHFEGKVKVAKVNVDTDKGLAAEYGIRGIPTVLVFKNGEVVDRMVGVQPKQEIEKRLNNTLEA